MSPSYEDQGTGFDSGARDYELQGRAPDPALPAPDADLPVTDARDDFATDPADQKAPPAASAPLPAAPAAQDGPKDPEPATDAPAAPTDPATVVLPEATAPEAVPTVTYLENPEDHPSRLPPAARPIRQG